MLRKWFNDAQSSIQSCLTMISSQDLRFVSLIAAQGSLAAAARALRITPSAATQRLQALEARLGVQLLDRSKRRAVPTPEGELLVEEGSRLLGDLDRLAELLHSRSGVVSGELRVMAPFGFGRRHVAPLVAGFASRNPQLAATLTLSEKPARGASETHDVILHIGELKDSSMIAHRIADNRRILCAAPAYLKRAGMPKSLAELAKHRCLVIRENDEDVTVWRFRLDGRALSCRVDPAMVSNDGEVARDWALAGQGIVLRSEWDVADHLRSGKLVRVLPTHVPPSAPIVALVPTARGLSARSRGFLEFVKENFAPAPPWRRRAA